MPRIYAVANQKGGVGKTTTVLSLAGFLAKSGRRTLVIDMDPQGNATSGLGFNRDPERASVYDVISGRRLLGEAVVASSLEGLDLLPSDTSLAGAELELVNEPMRDLRILRALESIDPGYRYVFLDCPPSLGLLTLNALVAARYLLVPLQSEFYALEGLGHLAATIELVRRQSNPLLELAGIVMTLFDRRTTLAQQVVEEVRRGYPDLIFNTMIPRNVRLSEAPSYGQPIAQYDPSSRGGEAYALLTEEFIARAERQLGAAQVG